MFSQRAGWDLTANELETTRAGLLSDGRPILDLTESNPTRVGLRYESERILEALSRPQALLYEPSSLGLLAAREAVARHYVASGLAVDPSNLVLTSSSSESYAYLLKLLCDPGESILVPRPSYPLFDDLARLEGVSLRGYPLRQHDGWRIDVQALEAAIDAATRAIFVVSPNNPTGSSLRVDEHGALQRIARSHGLALVCDEVFAEFGDAGEDRVRCAALGSDALCFSLGGLSKAAALPQMKLGWIIAGGETALRDEALRRLEVIADTYLSVGTPIQHAVETVLALTTDVQDQLRRRIERNRATLRTCTAGSCPVTALPSEGGWYAMLRVPTTRTDEQWAASLLASEGVLVHPGSYFGFESEGFLVLGLIQRPEVFEEGVRRLVAFIARHSSRVAIDDR